METCIALFATFEAQAADDPHARRRILRLTVGDSAFPLTFDLTKIRLGSNVD